MTALWKDIPGYEGYQINQFGMVKRLEKTVKNFGHARVLPEKLIKPYTKLGKEYIQLRRQGTAYSLSVARILDEVFPKNAEAFLGFHCPECDKTGTYVQMCVHAAKHGVAKHERLERIAQMPGGLL